MEIVLGTIEKTDQPAACRLIDCVAFPKLHRTDCGEIAGETVAKPWMGCIGLFWLLLPHHCACDHCHHFDNLIRIDDTWGVGMVDIWYRVRLHFEPCSGFFHRDSVHNENRCQLSRWAPDPGTLQV